MDPILNHTLLRASQSQFQENTLFFKLLRSGKFAHVHTTTARGGVKVQLHLFLTLA